MVRCSKEGKRKALQWAGPDARRQPGAHIRKLEEGLRLDKDVPLSTTLLDGGLVDEVGKQDNNLQALACHFTELGGHRLPWIKKSAYDKCN